MQRKRSIPKLPLFLVFIILGVFLFQYRSFHSTPILKKSESMYQSGMIKKDGIPAIIQPDFDPVSVADQYLNNDGLGIVIEENRVNRFYPYQILVWHHLVNDVVSSKHLLISYDPFAHSGVVFDRTMQGSILEFGISDKMQNSSLLLYDKKTESLWNPMNHTSIEGIYKGETLSRFPSHVMKWSVFKEQFPRGEVLSKDTGFVRDYTHDPYGTYVQNNDILFPVTHKDDRLNMKERIVGIEWNQKQKAYPLDILKKQNIVKDSLDGTSVSIEYDQKTGLVRTFLREAKENQQSEITVTESFWFSWVAAFPETDLYSF